MPKQRTGHCHTATCMWVCVSVLDSVFMFGFNFLANRIVSQPNRCSSIHLDWEMNVFSHIHTCIRFYQPELSDSLDIDEEFSAPTNRCRCLHHITFDIKIIRYFVYLKMNRFNEINWFNVVTRILWCKTCL